MLLCCLKDAQRVDLAEHSETVMEGRSSEQSPGWRTPLSAERAEQGNEVFYYCFAFRVKPKSRDRSQNDSRGFGQKIKDKSPIELRVFIQSEQRESCD